MSLSLVINTSTPTPDAMNESYHTVIAQNVTGQDDRQTEAWKRLDSIAFNIETYYLWVILALGFPANCSTIVTIIKMSPARSLTIYIALLAVVDNLAIVNKILMFVLTDNSVPIGPFGCKFLGFLGNFLITFANWLLVAMSVERFAAVWYPFKLGQFWTFKKSILAVVIIAVVLVAIFLHLFWTMDYYMARHTKFVYCVIHEDHIDFMVDVWFWINIIIYALLPCFLLIIFNFLIVTGIIRSSRVHQFLSRSSSVKNGNNVTIDRQRQITLMLLTAAVALVVLTTPRCVMLILSPYQTTPNETLKGATLYLIDTIAYVLCDSTHAINFYLYSFSARRFRRQFVDLVLCRQGKLAPGSAQYITLSSRPSVKFSMSLFRESVKKPSVGRTSNEM